MNTRKYFLNEHILPQAVIGSYNMEYSLYPEPFISQNDLIKDLQTKVNEAACAILNAPDENEKHECEVTWRVLYNLLTEIQKI